MSSESKYEYKFNEIVKGIVGLVSNICPSSFFAEYSEKIEAFINAKPAEPIAYFIEYVYQNDNYRRKIKECDEDFFLNTDFSSELDRDDISTLMRSKIITKVFSFKDQWLSLDDESRDLIKQAMLGLVKVTEKYINYLYETKVAKTKSTSMVKPDIVTEGPKLVIQKKDKTKQNLLANDIFITESEKEGREICNYDIDEISLGSSKSKKNKAKIKVKKSKKKEKYNIDEISFGSSKKDTKKRSNRYIDHIITS